MKNRKPETFKPKPVPVADAPSDDLPPMPVETLEDVERAALLLLYHYRRIFERPQEALGVLDACEQMEGPFGRELKRRIILAARKRLERADSPPDDSAEGAKQRAAQAVCLVVWEYLNWTNVNLSAARHLLPDAWERLEILPWGPPTKDLDAAERDWKRLIRAAGAERARQESKGRQAGGVESESTSHEARALALLVEHPDWTDKQIAEHIPCHAKSLYRWPRFKVARQAEKQGRNDLPRGTKYPDDDGSSQVEAWDP